nr:EAL domain-containing protein [uncultured Albidiferax sp.]
MIALVLRRLHVGRWRLSTHIVVRSLLLLLLVQAVGYWVVRSSIESNARDLVTAELQRGQSIWLGLLEQNAAKLRQGAALISGDFGFNTAVVDMHKESEKGAANAEDKDILVETIRDVLDTQGERIGPTVITALLDPQLQLIASNRTPAAKDVVDVLPHIIPPLANSKQDTKVTLVGDTAYQFVLVKMRAPLAESVLVGFRIDEAMALAMKKSSGLDVALLTQETPAKPLHISLSTLPKNDLGGLLAADRSADEIEIGGDTLVAQTIDLQAVAGSAQTVLLRSLSQLLAPYEALKRTMWWITALGLLLFGLVSTVTARSVTQPLQSLARDAKRLGDGTYDQPVHHTERRDEIGDLAKAFDQMRNDIADDKTQIEKLAYWDDLTQLPNRLNFRKLLKSEMEHRPAVGGSPQPPLAVITLNLDRFKHVNDILGYAEGDQLLKAVTARLLDCMDDGALVARLGGDEFSVLLHHADADATIQVAQAIALAFEAPFRVGDQPVDQSASMGIACWPQDAQDLDTLLGRAEVAMYVAKRKNTGFQRYDPALDSSSKQTLSLLSELRRAVEHNQLRLFLQPKIELTTGKVIAAEALVRWEHPERGLVPPDSFIPFAEQTGFVRQLTLWMFDEAARQWAGLQQPGQPLRISVNLSTRDLMALDFPDALDTLLAKHGVAPEGFCLEITESAIMDDPLRAEGTLNRLSERGFKLSIDDFGTGYSSLAYLKRLPVDELKIDKSFVMGMERDPDDAKIVRSTIDLAHNMGLSVVAEGVENSEIWHLLREQNCDEAQGYHMSKPLPVDKFKEWRERWTERAEV